MKSFRVILDGDNVCQRGEGGVSKYSSYWAYFCVGNVQRFQWFSEFLYYVPVGKLTKSALPSVWLWMQYSPVTEW
jgi:hypothetical protein